MLFINKIQMNKVWVFGDSFTAEINNKDWWGKLYIEYKGYIPKVYCDFIAEEFKMETRNMALGGMDNYSIFQRLCNNIDNINDGDIVIVGWGPTTRFRLFSETDNKLLSINSPSAIIGDDEYFFKNITNRTISEISVNRTFPIYFEELKSWEKLITKALKNNLMFFWNWSDPSNKISYVADNYLTICVETNNFVTDCHWAEDGHKKFAQEVCDILKKGM